MIKKVTDNIIYIGANDHELDLFEGQYTIPDGMAYNSYAIIDDAIAIMDTIDEKKTDEWLGNIENVIGERKPDYLVIQHMEPDHSASIKDFLDKYPDTVVVGNARTFVMINQFFCGLKLENKKVVCDGDTLSLGKHCLNFVFAPMVHWPEVMMTYESTEKVLFSADAFGKFGALDVEDDDWACEARRYYFGIVGKYGRQVQNVFEKLKSMEINKICPLHGPALEENLKYYIDLYDTWSSYRPESKGVCICYTSVYGHTKEAVKLLADKLEEKDVKVVVHDLARSDMAEAVEDAFRYDTLVLATTTYNGDMFTFMRIFIDELIERGYQNRRIAFIENGSWAPQAMKRMKDGFNNSKDIVYTSNNITIKSAISDDNIKQIQDLAEELSTPAILKDDKLKGKGGLKKYVCDICGYVYEGEELPEDFYCPLCKGGKEHFSEEKPKVKKFVCDVCGYVYEGEELPEDFKCPVCKVGSEHFIVKE